MTQSDHPAYSVVVPVLNEAGNIEPLISEIVAVMDSLDGSPTYEIVYVDDGSSDGTAEELSTAAASQPRLKTFRHDKPCGQSQALITGVSRALGLWIITLDGDGQNDPADIPKLIEARDEALAAEPNKARRFLFIGHRSRRIDSLGRRYQSWLANDVRGWLLGDHTPDGGCGLKLIARDVFLELPRFDALHRFLPALVLRAGGRAVSIEISHRSRLHGRSKYGFWRRLALNVVDFLGVLWLIARHSKPELNEKKDEV